MIDRWVAGGATQFGYILFAEFFDDDRHKIIQILSNIRQFEIWTNWIISTSAKQAVSLHEVDIPRQ
jgi:hypothetical protein